MAIAQSIAQAIPALAGQTQNQPRIQQTSSGNYVDTATGKTYGNKSALLTGLAKTSGNLDEYGFANISPALAAANAGLPQGFFSGITSHHNVAGSTSGARASIPTPQGPIDPNAAASLLAGHGAPGGSGGGDTSAFSGLSSDIAAVMAQGQAFQNQIFGFAQSQAAIHNAFVREALDVQMEIAERSMSVQEAQLAMEQTRFQREEQQFALMQGLAPQLAQQFGINPKYDAKGNLTGFNINTSKFFDPTLASVVNLYHQKTKQAAAGQVSPLALKLFQEEEQKLVDAARRNLGPGYATSTPFLQAMNLFQRDKTLRLAELNRQDIQTFGALTAQTQIAAKNAALTQAGASLGWLSPQTTTTPTIPNMQPPQLANIPNQGATIGAAANVFGNQASVLRQQIAGASQLGAANITAGASMHNAQLDAAVRQFLGNLGSQTDIQVANINAQATIDAARRQASGQRASGLGSLLGTLGSAAILKFSDRNAKANINPADKVLDKLDELEVFTWRYIGDEVKHIGPMAQDFKRVMDVGDSDRYINMVDAFGVCLKAIKELRDEIRGIQHG